MNETELAYIAGIIDGEGTISITNSSLKTDKKKPYSVVLRISNTDKRMLLWIRKKTGMGYVRRYSVAMWERSNIKKLWRWQIHRNEIRQLVPLIEPYLIIKKKQAELIIRFLKLTKFKGKCITENIRNKKERICLQMYKLNK